MPQSGLILSRWPRFYQNNSLYKHQQHPQFMVPFLEYNFTALPHCLNSNLTYWSLSL